MEMLARRPRILFIAEPLSLAHVVRLATLARALDATRYEVWFASPQFPEMVFAGTHFIRRSIASEHPATTLARVARGQRMWDADALARYVASDLRLLNDVRPDLVIGDMRLSLTVSAPVSGVRYAPLINAYWSPYAVRAGFPIPDHPIVRLLGVQRIAPRYGLALPLVLQHFTRPLNRLRRRHGLAPFAGFLELLTFGDYTLHPDVPELIPTRDLPSNHLHLGALTWSPPVAMPAFWDRIDHRRPLVYVTLGSSGELRAYDAVLEAARRLPITMVVATAGRFVPKAVPSNVWVTDFVPGDRLAKRASLVICNGGSTTGYQALQQGTPVLGIPFNFDQYLAVETIVRAGAGLYVRSGDANPESVCEAIQTLLNDERFARSAREVGSVLRRYDACERFREFVDHALPAPVSRDEAPDNSRRSTQGAGQSTETCVSPT